MKKTKERTIISIFEISSNQLKQQLILILKK
jgi:hypothetical protein